MNAGPSPAAGPGSTRLAIDVGGTFTDLAVLDEEHGEVRFDKVPTTPDDAARGVIDGFGKAGVEFGSVSYFVHGTTLAVNALLTRSGARVALITTLGFRDVYELGRTDREVMYDLTYRKPLKLVPRRHVHEVRERMTFEGEPLIPLDREDACRVAMAVREAGVEAVAVCFLHSYANPAHEDEMARILGEVAPDLDVTLSHRLVREYREYERTSTAVVDAYIKPITRRYLQHLVTSLHEARFGGRFLVTRSGGGAMTVETAIEQPAHMVLSGPASGVIGAAAFADLIGKANLVTIDLGGTSLDASLIVGGAPTTMTEATFEGESIALPSLNIKTVGAGGGSIAWIDAAGHMQVGPQSAGAQPGPACYGRGGSDATLTDAALLIGYLGEQTALGGELTLVRSLAHEAIARLGATLSIDPIAVAEGIIDIILTRVIGTVREITVEQGHAPADFDLLTFGGGGGFIAVEVARQLGIPRVIVPPGPGAFSALGMLFTDVIHDFSQTRVLELSRAQAQDLEDLFAELEERGRAALNEDGFAADRISLIRTADLRFAGQEHTVEVPVPSGPISAEALEALPESFASLHEDRYGHRMDDPVELVTARLRAIGRVPRPELPLIGPGDLAAARTGEREVFRRGERMAYAVYHRAPLGKGDVIQGPAIVEEYTSTTVLHRGDRLQVGDHGELIISVEAEGEPIHANR